MLADKIVGILAPHTCIGCGKRGSVLCKSCLTSYVEPVQPRCAGCKALSDDFKTCTGCRRWLNLTKVYVAVPYSGLGERLVHELKYEMKRDAGEAIALQLKGIIGSSLENKNAVLCPVPTAPKRVRERGFDHSVIIAKELSRLLHVQAVRALKRVTNSRQVGATRAERMKQMEYAFSVSKKHIQDKDVYLIDDVFTTGATLIAASKVLREAGARSVSAIVFCQK